jgi:uncharacterized protein YneF (UPF0154 family)
MLQSNVKFGANSFENDFKFSKEYYSLYNNIFNDNVVLTYEIFIFLILQISLQNKFQGYYDELYEDIIRRKSEYFIQLIKNFKISFLGEQKIVDKIYRKFFNPNKMTEKEIYFKRKLSTFDLDRIFDNNFVLNNNDIKMIFVTTCQKVYEQKIYQMKQDKHIHSAISKIVCI